MSESEKEPWIPIRLVNLALDVKDAEIRTLTDRIKDMTDKHESQIKAMQKKMDEEMNFLRLTSGWARAERLEEEVAKLQAEITRLQNGGRA